VLGFCILSVWGGIAKITDDSFSYSMERWGPFEITPQTSGWFMLVVGLAFGLYALLMIVRRCPTLTLDETGILFSRCIGDPVQLPWSRLADVIVRRASIPARGRVTRVEMVYLVADDGKEIGVGDFGLGHALADTIRRVATRMNSPLRGTA
jgi:hypothetical protein